MDTYRERKYNTTPENLKYTIDKYGVAVIPNVLTQQECETSLSEMWSYFEHITKSWNLPLNRNNPNSYVQFYKLFPLHSMLIQHFQIGHAQFAWNLRQNPKIVKIFADFYDTRKKDMLVSFDGASLHLPPEITKRGYYRGNDWYHTDQSYTRPVFECLQSFITLNDIEPGDATLSFLEGSNKYHKQFSDEFKIDQKDDWFKLNEEHKNYYIDTLECPPKRIATKRGSLVLWDSRTIHCGSESMKDRPNPKIRAVVYLCYQPRDYITISNLNKKIKAFEALRTTSHYPAKPKLFPKLPRTYGNQIPEITEIEPPVLSDLGKRLVGYD